MVRISFSENAQVTSSQVRSGGQREDRRTRGETAWIVERSGEGQGKDGTWVRREACARSASCHAKLPG